MVKDVRDWRWSSYHATVGLQHAPDWLAVPTVLSLFTPSTAAARTAYGRFVSAGVGHPSPWAQVRSQIFLGGPDFLERIERLVRGKPVANVPSAQIRPTRPSADEILKHVATTYRVGVDALLDRTHREAYHTALYLLRRAVNEPLPTVAIRFCVSPSRISKIQRAIEQRSVTTAQRHAFTWCKVKN